MATAGTLSISALLIRNTGKQHVETQDKIAEILTKQLTHIEEFNLSDYVTHMGSDMANLAITDLMLIPFLAILAFLIFLPVKAYLSQTTIFVITYIAGFKAFIAQGHNTIIATLGAFVVSVLILFIIKYVVMKMIRAVYFIFRGRDERRIGKLRKSLSIFEYMIIGLLPLLTVSTLIAAGYQILDIPRARHVEIGSALICSLLLYRSYRRTLHDVFAARRNHRQQSMYAHEVVEDTLDPFHF